MAYQQGPHSTYPGPANNAPHFPHSQSHLHLQQQPPLSIQQQQQQQHSHFYPSQYPPHFDQPQSNASSPPTPSSYSLQHPSDAQTYQAQRQTYPSNHIQNGGGPLMQRPMLPDDHFKKPYLPQQPYINHVQPPTNFIDHQRQRSISAVSDLAPAPAYPGASTTPNRLHTSSSSYPPTTMTVTAPPTNPPSAQSTPTSEVPSQSADPALQPDGLSSLDQQRVDALLQVNNLLIQEVTSLQKLGFKPSPQSPQQTVPPNTSPPQANPAPPISAAGDPATTTQSQINSAAKTTTPTTTTPTTTTPTTATAPQQQSLNTKKFVEFMTRIKTNIMFLVSISDQAKDKPRLPYPSHLEAPPLWLNPGNEEGDRQLDLLREEYARLRELWPEWKPEVRKPQTVAQQAQQGQQGQQQMVQQQS